MDRSPTLERDQPEFPPRAGVRARRWERFERAFAAWLESADGRFASYYAARACEPVETAEPARSAPLANYWQDR